MATISIHHPATNSTFVFPLSSPPSTLKGNPTSLPYSQSLPQNSIYPKRTIFSSQGSPISTSPSLKQIPTPLRITHPNPQLSHLPQHPDYITNLLLMNPNLILHSQQPPLPPENCPITTLLLLLLTYLPHIEVVSSQRPSFDFIIASPTGKAMELIWKCLMEPHWHHFCWFGFNFSG